MWDQQFPYFQGVPLLSLIFLQISNHLRNSRLCLTSSQVWRLLNKLEFSHTAHTVPCMAWSFLTLGERGTGPAGSQPQVSQHLPPSPTAASPGKSGLFPTAAAGEEVPGHLVATARAELVKTNIVFSFVDSTDLCPGTEVHRAWILNNKVAVVTALTDHSGSAFMAQDVFGVFFQQDGDICSFVLDSDFFPIPFCAVIFAKYLFRGKLKRVRE